MNDFYEFQLWEVASRDTIDVKTVYLDLAGDLAAGFLLSQIIYWHLPGKNGKTKLRVKHSGHLWIAKARDEWWDEIRITDRQFDRARKILEDKNLIEVIITNFDGRPVPHIRLKKEEFVNRLNELVKSTLRNGEVDFTESVKSITENTAENTSEIASAPESSAEVLRVPRAGSFVEAEMERDYQEDLEFEEGLEYVDADPFAEDNSLIPKWRRPENYNWQNEGVLVAAMDATRLRNFQTKKEWSAWRKFDKSMVPLSVLMTTENRYPTEWIMNCIEWARKKNLSARTASGSFSTVIRFKSLISLIENEGKKNQFVEKWIKDHEEKEVEEQFKDSDDGLSDNPFADR